MDFKTIGRRISEHRKRKGMTQAVFSEVLGVSEGYVSRMECGTTKVSLQRLETIADILDTDIGLLVSDKVILPEAPVSHDVCELIKDWTPTEISILIEYLKCANRVRIEKQ